MTTIDQNGNPGRGKKVRPTIDQDGMPVENGNGRPEMRTVRWHGAEFQLPAAVEDFPADAVEAFEAEKAMTAVHLILGEEQWGRLKEVSSRSVREVGELFELLAKEAGFTSAGESGA